jgi:hypothetical protein
LSAAFVIFNESRKPFLEKENLEEKHGWIIYQKCIDMFEEKDNIGFGEVNFNITIVNINCFDKIFRISE